MTMKHKRLASILTLGFICSAPSIFAQAPQSPESLEISSAQVQYIDVGLGGPKVGAVWGDPSKGAYGAFLRLPKGFVSPLHVHTGDYYGVVVEGTVVNAEEGHREIPLKPGSYYFQRGKTDHVTKCLGDVDCLIYMSQSQASDFIVRKK